MSTNEKKTKGNSNQDLRGLDRTLFLVLRLEFAIELGRIRLDKRRRRELEAERQIAGLFDEAYDLVKTGASRSDIAKVLGQIRMIAQRSGFTEDHNNEEEKEEDDPG